MFFGTAKCKVNSRRLWSGAGGKSDAASVPAIQQTPETVSHHGFGGGGYSHSIVAGGLLVIS